MMDVRHILNRMLFMVEKIDDELKEGQMSINRKHYLRGMRDALANYSEWIQGVTAKEKEVE